MTSAATQLIDFRSDTVTRPDEQMRRAMASAEVGDNVIDVDPTVRELEERAAAVLGMPAALWTPSGTMANLIALSVHLKRGDRFLAPNNAHVLNNELGSAAWLAGGMPEALPHDGGPGRPKPETVAAAIGTRSGPYYALRTTLLCLENTHNAAGGAVIPPHEHAQLPPAALTVGVDSVSACFSKGLGAPAGSVVAGSREFVERARRMRQMLGGGMRQIGVLAAACLVALDRVPDLAAEHEKARRLADGLRELGWQADTPETNIVLAPVADIAVTLESLQAQGVLALPMAGKVRFVLHRDVSPADVDEALRRIKAGGHP